MVHRLHTLWLLSGCFAGLLAAPATAQTRILFVGNSFTHGNTTPVLNYNAAGITDENYGLPPSSPRYQADPAMPGPWGGVPGIFKKMTDQSGRAYDVHMEAVSAAALSYHYTNALGVMQQGPWDQVVLQENSFQPLPVARTGRPADFLNYATRLEQAVHAGSPAARVYLFQTWARADMTYPAGQPYSGLPIDTMARDLRRAYAYLAGQNPRIAAVAAVGDAWLRAIQAGVAVRNPYNNSNPGLLSLWGPDNLHASKWGSYLAACVLFAQLTGLDPRTLGPAEQAAVALDITGPTAVALQQVAFQQVFMSAEALPVVLTSFAAQRQAAGVRLHWATATEEQNARFDVQRSPDGVAFVTISSVPGHGTTLLPTRYTVLDALAPVSTSYYRLRQVDVSGAATYSPVVAVGPAAALVSLYPNPARERLFIMGQAATAYRVRNSLGQVLRQGSMPTGQATVELVSLPGGLYQLELETAAGQVRRTFTRE
ncbi:T9SS type A sorting domain-containing protein [Microvirga sp. STS02]|uniref:T9SS type A sorting domain-containing protein n=1 Tax=Hymenobacter negativus TaxID=2795026 RepID=UPI0018DBC308|nr:MULTISPECIES: T9SS type A sorting domain-containing protein [Bacteria]MBH8568312.1 T9SS type A sorting domain-containing protein [Hymenobacter negativus]MBR7208047.1 T9SS type A sorting domain-containing protein [Microvirga sp. STS02]